MRASRWLPLVSHSVEKDTDQESEHRKVDDPFHEVVRVTEMVKGMGRYPGWGYDGQQHGGRHHQVAVNTG
jgi:hypothetical protein